MNFSPIPKTPVRTPQTGTSTKSLQLTPIWETVVRSRRIPSDVNEDCIFQEISSRLEDLEWPVRQHAFRVLYDIIPIVSKDRLDERIIENDILNKLITNLGHPAPGVRKVAMETIRQYMKQTRYSEKMLESFVIYGVDDEDEAACEELGIVRENVTLGTIMSLVDILKPFIFPENGGYAISEPFLNKLVFILSEKMKSPLYQEKCAETLWKIREMIGEHRFLRTLDHLPDKALLNVIRTRDRHDKMALEVDAIDEPRIAHREKMENGSGSLENHDSDQSFDMELSNSVTTYHNYKMISKGDQKKVTEWLPGVDGKIADYSTEEYSDGTDTDTYTKETVRDDLDGDRFLNAAQPPQPEAKVPASFIPIEDDICPVRTPDATTAKVHDRDVKTKEMVQTREDTASESSPPSPRVVLETEIQFSEDKAIKMTIVEDEKDSAVKDNEIDLFPAETDSGTESGGERRFVTEDGDLIMKILHNSENDDFHEEERNRTPRRVRFGGEVIKLRTPDSDATDVTIEIQDAEEASVENPNRDSPARPATAHRKAESRPRPEIKIVPPNGDTSNVDQLIVHDRRPSPQSHIPLPISPATTVPSCQRSRNASPSKRIATPAPPVDPPSTEAYRGPTAEGGNETRERQDEDDDDDDGLFWKWTELGLLRNDTLSDLKNQIDWKIQYRALEDLKLKLVQPKATEKIGRTTDNALPSSLFKFLLQRLPRSNHHQVTALSVSVVFHLIQALPKECIARNLDEIVVGLCRHVGGCKNVNLKIESVQTLKMLFSLLEPSSVIDILLEHCLTSSSSKMRENSLLAIMYATMTFPSNLFDVEKILGKVATAVSDSRRKVRHAALEAISVLSQFCSSEVLAESVSRVAEMLPNTSAKSALISAVQTRLCRRTLPTVSSEGLVLYSLQIPASRRFGSLASPSGADVDWILSGTGSVSTGSAKSRGQLNAAQRLDITAPFSPKKWHSNNQALAHQNKFSNSDSNVTEKNNKKMESENPWTINKNRTELSARRNVTQDNWKNRGSRFFKAPSTGNLAARVGDPFDANIGDILHDQTTHAPQFGSHTWENTTDPEHVSWALVPISTLEEQQLARIKNNQLWGEFGAETGTQYVTSPLGTLRPLYLKLQPNHEHLTLSRSTDDLRRSSFSYASQRTADTRHSNDDFTQIRVLTPSILREKNKNDDGLHPEPKSSAGRISKKEVQEDENSKRIPPIHSSVVQRNSQKPLKGNELAGNERKPSEESPGKQNGAVIQNGGQDISSGSCILFPNIHNQFNGNHNHDYGYVPGHKPLLQQYPQIDDSKIQETVTQLNGLLNVTSKNHGKPAPVTVRSSETQLFAGGKNQPAESETIITLRNGVNKKSDDLSFAIPHAKNKLFDSKRNQSEQSTVASAPPLITSTGRNQTPSTSSSNSTDIGAINGSAIKLQRLKNGSGALISNNHHSFRSANGCHNQKIKGNRAGLAKCNKVVSNGTPFPDNLKPFERPKEGLDTCFSQLESQQWEVVMLGLTSLVRLLRHHPAIVLNHIHPVIMAVGGQIRNLRSQVSRTACQAAAEMFVALKRNIEVDLEELAGPLFHRSADTNRFIRSDCSYALDKMVDNVSLTRSLNVIISKGSVHQNAIVRTVAARLLLRLTEKVGPEKILTLPREIRDKVVQTGANLLLEGKQETRGFAKDLFRMWSSHPSFSNLILDVIPPNVMRHISKTLISLKT